MNRGNAKKYFFILIGCWLTCFGVILLGAVILKAIQPDRHNVRDVVFKFGTALVENNAEVAKSHATAQLWERIDTWSLERTPFYCPASTDIDNHGITVECDLCGDQSEPLQCCRFYYTCGVYRLSVRDIVLREEQFGYRIVDWEAICVTQEVWQEPTCE